MRRRLHLLLLHLYRRLPRKVRRWVVREISPNYTVGCMCLVERNDGALLLVRHAYRGRWGVPGGLLKRKEDPTAAVHREVWEEIRVAVELLGEPSVVVAPSAQRVDIVFGARLADPDARPMPSSPEIDGVAWFLPDELPELQEELAAALVARARAARSPSVPAISPRPRAPNGSGDRGPDDERQAGSSGASTAVPAS